MHRLLSFEMLVATFMFACVLMASVSVFAWTAPTQSPPNGNVGAPVNVGSLSQTKAGGLGVTNMIANQYCIGASCISAWPTGGGGGQWASTTNGIYYNAGNVGIGTNSPGYSLTIASGNAQFPTALAVLPSTHATSRRAALTIDNWLLGQDASGNGTKDFFLWDSVAGAARLFVNTSGNVGIGTNNPTGKLDVNGIIVNGGFDFDLGTADQVSRGNTGFSRALVKDLGSKLVINYAGDFTGGVRVDGPSISAAAFLYSSDQRLKKNIAPLDQGLVELMRVRPVSFVWNEKSKREGESDIGFIAQEVEKIVPGIVHTDDDTGMKSVDYIKLTPILVKAIQEQQGEIESQRSDFEALKKEFEAYKNTHQ